MPTKNYFSLYADKYKTPSYKYFFSLTIDKYIYTFIYTCLACFKDGCNPSTWAEDKYELSLLPFVEDCNCSRVGQGTYCDFFSSSITLCETFFKFSRKNIFKLFIRFVFEPS